ncbi:SRPBCC family protein [Methanobacterium paludis]|uniref:Polyketide cyclase/dehydrase n=1 Tax=Methanobacterium paludis (strain DSM 25820 / JCM 18151 / SWAN1) TaxID=868131 RepID=F6D4W7_METPW|nr:SRPBCC family protein [Methanobacterium paludis]AEG18838.1 Polyketide cyclase/dehydrase [Methanobacterium paludis]
MKINENAPVVATGEIDVLADLETVWDVMVSIDKWPSWNPEVKDVFISGEVVEGSKFQWKAGPGTIKSIVQRVEKPNILAWTGRTLGINAIHVWQLRAHNDGTIIRTEESWEGLMVRILHGTMQKMLQDSIDSGLQYLKIEAEKRKKEI